MNIYLELFWTFAKIGVCTFGGGYAMLPILQRELVEKRGWATEEELSDYFAIGQCTPGIIAVNTATFVGHSRKGAAGGVVATLGLVFPCLVIIMLVAAFLQNFGIIVYCMGFILFLLTQYVPRFPVSPSRNTSVATARKPWSARRVSPFP